MIDMICEAEALFDEIVKYLQTLSDGIRLSSLEDKKLRSLLDQYWHGVECPEGKTCLPNNCLFAKPIPWVEYHGYTSLGDLLYSFEYEGIEVLKLKNRGSINPLDAHWARRDGHFSP
jgi:hypothetical protein